ncbi:MAG: hypothetical protein HY674_15090 [Chloroflexi bacterium]|nr:hypothetical protein [Chloroflexota bacterium]
MLRVLHILTTPDDTLAAEIISGQRRLSDRSVQVVDLTVPDPDYRALLEEIFAADSVEVW